MLNLGSKKIELKGKLKFIFFSHLVIASCYDQFELIEDGFEVAMVADANASAILLDIDGNQAAQTKFRMIANLAYKTAELRNAIELPGTDNLNGLKRSMQSPVN